MEDDLECKVCGVKILAGYRCADCFSKGLKEKSTKIPHVENPSRFAGGAVGAGGGYSHGGTTGGTFTYTTSATSGNVLHYNAYPTRTSKYTTSTI